VPALCVENLQRKSCQREMDSNLAVHNACSRPAPAAPKTVTCAPARALSWFSPTVEHKFVVYIIGLFLSPQLSGM